MSLRPRIVRITRARDHVELYFPPLRMPEVALPLALFGVIATTLPALAIGGLLPSLEVPSGVLSAILMASFVLPFGLFGAAFVLLAFYMLCNALMVRVDGDAIVTERVLFGIVARRRKILRSDIASIDAEIASRYQSLFSSDPVYQLVARGMRHHKRVIVAETLKGQALMNEVKAVIDPQNL
ncbi:MAG: hypothetical protein ACXWC3_18995, partial [Burkholderiales bacterium]